jgi:uncharacterized membrane protein YdbT with pleckstrin-like domain
LAYFDRAKQPDEQIVFRGRIHWMIYLPALFSAALGVALVLASSALGHALSKLLGDPELGPTIDKCGTIIFTLFGALFVLKAFFSWAGAFYRRLTTEIFVTDKRVLIKRHLIARRTQEMNLSKVETVDVRQSIVERLLGAGFIAVIGTGGSWEPIGPVGSPVKLRNAIAVG